MARTPSTMLELGTAAPAFRLLQPSTGREVGLDDFAAAEGLVVVFMCNHCPFVKRIAEGLARFADDYQPRGIAMVGINANDAVSYPDDGPQQMLEEARRQGYNFPYLYDETQAVAKAYHAACTPDFFLFDAERRLVYRGQFDDARPGNEARVTGADLRAAADALLAGRPIAAEQKPSLGCNIKWKEGGAPDYSLL